MRDILQLRAMDINLMAKEQVIILALLPALVTLFKLGIFSLPCFLADQVLFAVFCCSF